MASFPPDLDLASRTEKIRSLPLERLMAVLQPKPGLRFLDCAGRGGSLNLPLAEMLGGRGTFFNLEFEDREIRLFSSVLQPSFPCVRLPRGKAERIPLPDDCLDRVLIGEVLHTLTQKAAFMAEIRRLLSPGGLVCLMEKHGQAGGMQESEGLEKLREAGFAVAVSHAGFKEHWCLTAKK